MQATYTVSNAGNTAIQSERWEIPMQAALLAVEQLDRAKRAGSYWHSNFGKPVKRAKRAGFQTVTIYTAGFSTGELANVLACVGCEYSQR